MRPPKDEDVEGGEVVGPFRVLRPIDKDGRTRVDLALRDVAGFSTVTDGAFTVDDYANDPRVSPALAAEAGRFLAGQDLILSPRLQWPQGIGGLRGRICPARRNRGR